jgi:phosphoribosylaminoimidazolecarboxamide formyltransferase/IMP cyclohydrolase
VLAELKAALSDKTASLSVAAFNRIAQYDGAISDYLSWATLKTHAKRPAPVPGQFNGSFVKVQDLRYGENPHQQAAFYRDLHPAPARWPPAAAGQGAELQQHRRRRCRLGMRQELRRRPA